LASAAWPSRRRPGGHAVPFSPSSRPDSAAEQAAEVARLVSLGAEQVDWDLYPDDPDFVVLAEPEGNMFCIVNTSHGHE